MFNNILCFSADTNVAIPGGEKNICSIKEKDEILTYNFHKSVVEISTVMKKVESLHNNANRIFFEDNTDVVCTEDHPFWVVNKGWAAINKEKTFYNFNLCVNSLGIGDRCLSLKENKITEIRVVKIDALNDTLKMYNISDNVNKCFFANSFLVHDENIMMLH